MSLLLAEFWLPDATTLYQVGPGLCLLTGMLCILLAPRPAAGQPANLAFRLALLASLVATAWNVHLAATLPEGKFDLFAVALPSGESSPALLVVDRFGASAAALVTATLAASLWLSAMLRDARSPEYFVLLLGSTLGMTLLCGVEHILTLLVAIELASMPAYALAGFQRTGPAAEAAMKYSLFGACVAGFTAFGASLLFGLTGTLHIPTLVTRLAAADLGSAQFALLGAGLVLLSLGVLFKISAVPAHFWCPDVFCGASLPIAAWLSVASKIGGLVVAVRLGAALAASDALQYTAVVLPIFTFSVAIVAAVTMTWANLAAYQQTDTRRLLAYSSIAQAGNILALAALALRSSAGPTDGAGALLQYAAIYLCMNVGAFAALALVAVDTGHERVESFRGLGWRAPITAAALTICLFGLVGLPPTGGFVAKFWALAALSEGATLARGAQASALWGLVFFVVFNTLLSLFYYVRIVREMYLSPPPDTAPAWRAPVGGRILVTACALFVLLFGTLLVNPLKRAADYVTASPSALVSRR